MNERDTISIDAIVIDPGKGPQINYFVKDFDYRDASEESWVRLGYLIGEIGLSYSQAIEVLNKEYQDAKKNTDLTPEPK